MPAALQPSDPSPSDGPQAVLREDGIQDNTGKACTWHTCGSGKTLSSFKASTLLKENDSIHKCVFLVDRKDLPGQLFYSTQIPVCLWFLAKSKHAYAKRHGLTELGLAA